MKYTFQTDSAAEGLRIDACIRRFLPELPSRAAQEAFSHRDVKLDGKRVKPDVRVHAGQCVEVFCMEQTAPLLDVVYRMRMYCWSTSGRASAWRRTKRAA